MEIKEIVIQTDDLKGTENFYANVLGFELIKKEQNTIAFLAGNSIYTCINHNEKIMNRYFDILDTIFLKIKKFMNNNSNIEKILEGPVCISGIRPN